MRWHLLLGAAGVAATAACSRRPSSPEDVALAYHSAARSVHAADRLTFIIPVDSARYASDSGDGEPQAILGSGLGAYLVDATDGAARVVEDSAERLPVPLGDTAAVAVYGQAPATSEVDSVVASARAAGLIRDTLALSALVKRAWEQAKLRPFADTLWMVRHAGTWRVWVGNDLRQVVDSLTSRLGGRSIMPDTTMVAAADDTTPRKVQPLPSLSERQAWADQLEHVVMSAPPALLDSFARNRAAEAVVHVRETAKLEHELNATATILPGQFVQEAEIRLAGASSERAFSVTFVVTDQEGNRSEAVSPDMLWGTRPERVSLESASRRRLRSGPATVQLIEAFELDVRRLRWDFLGG